MTAASAAEATEPGPVDTGRQMDFAVTTRGILQEQINLADSKAGVLSTVSILILAYVVRVGGGPVWEEAVASPGWETLVAVGALLGLGAGIAGALSVVIPRTAGEPQGYVFWQAILEFGSAEAYTEAVSDLTEEEVAAALLEDCHRLSTLCRRKFSVLRWAMWAAGIGLLLSLLWLALFS